MGTRHVLAVLVGMQAAAGATTDKPEETKAYFVDVKQVMEPIIGFELTRSDIHAAA